MDDLTEAEQAAIRLLLEDDTDDKVQVENLRAAMRSRDYWRMRAPVEASEYDGVTGDQIRAWLTARGWTPTQDTGWNSDLGWSVTWRAGVRDSRGVTVFDKIGPIGTSRSVGGMAYHFDLREREVLDQLAGT